MIASFVLTHLETHGDLAVGEVHQHVCHVGVARGRDETASELVARSSVKSGGYYGGLAWKAHQNGSKGGGGKATNILMTKSGSNS